MELFKLLGTIAIDNSEANKALDETSDKGEKTKSKLATACGAIGKGAVAVGKTVASGLAVGSAAFAGLATKALGATGELEQNMGGSEAVFGKYATNMQNKAKEAFSQMGLSTSDYLATANKMGSLFQGAGFSIEESMDLSSGAMQRAADVASIMGIDTASAMEAIAGAAKGNFTMMDNLGVAMNDTTLQAYALEKGISKSTSEMTNQEKIGLAMEMFMEKTAYAAGNYAKENETLAGSLGTAKAALTNFLDGSGSVEDLVSSFGNLANVAVNSLTEILPRLTTGLTELVNQLMPKIPPLLQKLLPSIVTGATALINGLVTAFPGIITVLMDTLPALIQGIQTIINSLIEAMPGIIEALVSALPTLIPLIINGLVSMIVTLCSNIAQIIQPIIDALPDIIISIVEALVNNLPALIQGCVSLVVGIVSALPQIIMSLVQAMPTVIKSLVRGLISAAPALIQGMKDIWNSVKTAVVEVVTGLVSTVTGWVGKLKDLAVAKFTELKTSAVNKFNDLKSAASAKFESIKSAVVDKITGLKNKAVDGFNSVKTKATEIFNKVKTAIENPIQKARDTIKGIVDKIKGFFSGLKLKFPDIKLPHFKVSPSGWKIGDLLKGSIPKLGIEWYAKAMQNPIVMTKPTIWGYNPDTGKLQGGGEAGTEVVSGANTLMNMIQTAVSGQNDGILYLLERILEILAEYFPEFAESLRDRGLFDPDAAARLMAKPMNRELGRLRLQEERGR